MKAVAAILIVLAIGLAVIPQFTDCQSQGKMITLPNGKQIPMKCHWSAQAELALAVPLAAVGVMLAAGKRRETGRFLSITGAILGVLAILVPTALIGVCDSSEMICRTTMEPSVILMGTLVILASLVGLVLSGRLGENA
ncbi:MAG: DUF4418 family protein [Anaerolineae bacterium]